MIKLSRGIYVAASHITKISCSAYDEKVNVQLSDGEVIVVLADPGKTRFDKQEEIVNSVRTEARP